MGNNRGRVAHLTYQINPCLGFDSEVPLSLHLFPGGTTSSTLIPHLSVHSHPGAMQNNALFDFRAIHGSSISTQGETQGGSAVSFVIFIL